jgi:hypothetical protein
LISLVKKERESVVEWPCDRSVTWLLTLMEMVLTLVVQAVLSTSMIICTSSPGV